MNMQSRIVGNRGASVSVIGQGTWMDRRGTSRIVIKFGVASEIIAHELWLEHEKLVFASSANPSGKGNSSRIARIGERIHSEADLVIAADGFVRSIQPWASEHTRYEQGVMVSMVDP